MVDRIEKWLASDKVTRLLGYGTLIVVVTMMVLAGLTIPRIVSNTEASRRTDDLASCRASYAAAVDEATVKLFDAYGDVQSGIAAGVIHAIRQDPTTLALVAAELETAEQAKREAIERLVETSKEYTEAVALSQDHPDIFLDNCQESP